MKRRVLFSAVALGCGVLLGCSGDIGQMMASNPEMQARVSDAIVHNSQLAGPMIDKLLASDSSRTWVMDRVMANGPAMQSLMMNIATDPNMIDGVLGLAVQDSSMRSHVMTLLKGIQMAEGAK